MCKLQDLVDWVNHQFPTKDLDSFSKESGLTYDAGKEIHSIGYATNLTVETVEKAKEEGLDLLVTHHDAWGFIYELKERVLTLLKEYEISHYFVHLPLDDASFGTNSSLLKELGLVESSKHCCFDGYCCGALGHYEKSIPFEDFREKFETLLEEPSLSWNFGKKEVKSVYVLCGAGGETDLLKEAKDLGVDLYITGEKNLYTVQYAQLHQLNLIVGSHTYTELFGLKALMALLKDVFVNVKIVQIKEEHLETRPMKSS